MNNKATALITGAGARLGKHFAEHLAQKGYNLALHCNKNSQGIEELKKQLESTIEKQQGKETNISLHQCDFSDPDQATSLMNQANQAHQNSIQLLVNNAAIFPSQELNDFNAQDLMHCYSVNCFAPLLLMQAFSKRCKGGHIINILDTRVHHKHPERAIYSFSKQTLHQATLNYAKELAPTIRVNGICPGPVLPAADKSIKEFTKTVLSTPLQRKIETEDILNAFDYLNNSRCITGEILCVDSGQHLN